MPPLTRFDFLTVINLNTTVSSPRDARCGIRAARHTARAGQSAAVEFVAPARPDPPRLWPVKLSEPQKNRRPPPPIWSRPLVRGRIKSGVLPLLFSCCGIVWLEENAYSLLTFSDSKKSRKARKTPVNIGWN
jgi:hypothetical protein